MIFHATKFSSPGDIFDIFYALSSFLPGWDHGRDTQSQNVQVALNPRSLSANSIGDVYKTFMEYVISQAQDHDIPTNLLLKSFFSVKQAASETINNTTPGVAKPVQHDYPLPPEPESCTPKNSIFPSQKAAKSPSSSSTSSPPITIDIQAIQLASVLTVLSSSEAPTKDLASKRAPLYRLLDLLSPVTSHDFWNDLERSASLRVEVVRPNLIDVLAHGLPAIKRQEFAHFFYRLTDTSVGDRPKVVHALSFAPEEEIVTHVLSRLDATEPVILSTGCVHLLPCGSVSVGDGLYAIHGCTDGYYLRRHRVPPDNPPVLWWSVANLFKRASFMNYTENYLWRALAKTPFGGRESMGTMGKKLWADGKATVCDVDKMFEDGRRVESLVLSLDFSS
jgi:hypothetical protein